MLGTGRWLVVSVVFSRVSGIPYRITGRAENFVYGVGLLMSVWVRCFYEGRGRGVS